MTLFIPLIGIIICIVLLLWAVTRPHPPRYEVLHYKDDDEK